MILIPLSFSTPRFLIRFHETIRQTYGNQFLFERGYASKLKHLRKGKLVANSIWDMLVFNNIKAKFGGQVRVIITGAGKISFFYFESYYSPMREN
jgi:long-subunit acyl-CoA synthetase (AMP-forming)